ncbi:ribosomal protein S4 [Mycoplasma haemofelis str. Langford 1]|uniref:Small ribosomal subunit protein uS4 n=1 Tax=Mycoplasma haemofelis (strain Langford 1) TaxID=941640 RepID=E8ZKF1_MYCHL|nr:30S ribosomal protein S4 [Mycoplasma haemofelis]CBY92117.1 ribosomal protein S4 [Mycoplasma haemofelis str. Langford 1]
MSRFTGSIFKKSRKLGISLLENNREFTKWKKRTTPPGQHGNSGVRRKVSLYGEQLREKQKLALMYGLHDAQLRRFFKAARKIEGSLSYNLLLLLERRLDNVVYRMNFAPTRRAARQLVSHGHVLVNGKQVDIPSLWVNINDEIAIVPKYHHLPLVNMLKEYDTPDYVDVDPENKRGIYLRYPHRRELNQQINEVYVVEWFKRLV